MAKVITTLAADNNMDFENINSFKTENYIGIWDYNSDRFVLVPDADRYFRISILPACDSLKELNDAVFEECDEYIIEVFEDSDFSFVLEVDE